MTQVDLITGFLGAGKTTFLHGYAAWLMRQGITVGIVANDFGAVNVDRLLLQDLEGEHCLLEQVVGGTTPADWKRRLKAKLIALSMQGAQRILVEPSGLYDTETFFDVLYEAPVDTLCTVGSVLTVVDAAALARQLPPALQASKAPQAPQPQPAQSLSSGAAALLAGQLAPCGCVVLSHTGGLAPADCAAVESSLNALVRKHSGGRPTQPLACIPYAAQDGGPNLTDAQYSRLATAGYRPGCAGASAGAKGQFSALFFMKGNLAPAQAKACLAPLFTDKAAYGEVWRVKGFVAKPDGGWLEINATKGDFCCAPSKAGQQVLIVIGENLDKAAITARLRQYAGEDLVQG